MTTKKWLNCRLRDLQTCLIEKKKTQGSQGVRSVSLPVISRLLKRRSYRLRANGKSRESVGNLTPAERDTQFRYLQEQRQRFLSAGHPVLSVDTKKKELLGDFKNAGRIWCQEAEAVNVHDFPSEGVGRAVPYGLYDLAHNKATVYVGESADTGEFAADNLAHWCEHEMPLRFPNATELLIHADCGGSKGSRCKLWKQHTRQAVVEQLQQKVVDQFGLAVTVCHLPTGGSKWNPIKHRVFSEISKTWAGCPLRDFETLLNYLCQTTTKTGLRVTAHHIRQIYQKGIAVTAQVMKALNVTHHDVCPQWNYTLRPRTHNIPLNTNDAKVTA